MAEKSPKNILRALVDKYEFFNVLSSLRRRTKAGTYVPHGKVGEVIEKLPEADREILKQLKPEHNEQDRYTPLS